MLACGYNGFQQVSQFADKTEERSSKPENRQFYDKPLRLKSAEGQTDKQRIIITWSKIHFNPKSESSPEVLAVTGKHTLYKFGTNRLYINTDKRDLDVHTNVDIEHILGSEGAFYSIHDKGQLSELVVEDEPQKEDTNTTSTPCTLVPRPIFTSSTTVTSLSCGKEHVLFLTGSSQVFTFGLGSRGQLGHGSVEEEKSPRVVELLDGVGVVQVDAGGWHSAAVTATGDLFTWGWNEIGQLGHSSGNTLQDSSPLEESSRSVQQGKAGSDHTSTLPGAGIRGTGALEGTDVLISESTHTADLQIGSTGSTTSYLPETGSKKQNVQAGHESQESNVQNIGQPPSLEIEASDPSVLKSETFSGANGPTHTSFVPSNVIVDDEVVTLQSCPLLVTSLPEDYTAFRVSCGSRHTAVVTDDGKLYTTGWNKYGQLGQGHTQSRDRFCIVDVGNSVIKDVLCGWWNTVIFIEET